MWLSFKSHLWQEGLLLLISLPLSDYGCNKHQSSLSIVDELYAMDNRSVQNEEEGHWMETTSTSVAPEGGILAQVKLLTHTTGTAIQLHREGVQRRPLCGEKLIKRSKLMSALWHEESNVLPSCGDKCGYKV